MMRTRLIAVPLVLTAVLGGVAACGGKSDGSNSAACKKLQSDADNLGKSNPTSASELESFLSTAASKFKADEAGADSALKSTIDQAVTTIQKAEADAKAGNLTAAQSDLNGLDDLDGQLDKECPAEASDDSSS